MRIPWAWAVTVIAVLVLTVALPARAENARDINKDVDLQKIRDIELKGVVVAFDPYDRGFILNTRLRRGSTRVWRVRVTDQTQIQPANDTSDDEAEDDGTFPLGVGDVVIVAGPLVGNRLIVARQIKVVGHVDSPEQLGRPLFPLPPVVAGLPLLPPPQLFAPSNGQEINAQEILVAGRTVPGVKVHIEVILDAAFRYLATTADTWADANGVFAARVALPVGLPGAKYLIRVTSSSDGGTSAPATVIVRHS